MNCSDGSVGLLVWGDMPPDMRSALERNIRNALIVENGPSLVHTDSSSAPTGHKFPAIHFDYYVRNGTMASSYAHILFLLFYLNGGIQGSDAPQDIHPYLLRRTGVSRTNHYQFIPRVSKELMDHEQEYTNLCNSFEEFFIWVEQKVRVIYLSILAY